MIADRYEMLAPAAAALALRIPIAHGEGGEIAFGAIDDAVALCGFFSLRSCG